jgi:hypothetical protein
VLVSNEGAGAVDADTVGVHDAVPALGALFVGDLAGSGSGPVEFSDGAVASGLACAFTSLASLSDCVDFSSDGGATWTYVPVPDGGGFDDSVTHLRVRPTGVFAAATPGSTPSFELRFRMRVD